ncbi:MAG: glycerophosphodiester phosphodiesterase family protein [Clostridia bacterium]|nr:glycerophosphodiester phosphodiesterase family protein [Clostridia bacterium]
MKIKFFSVITAFAILLTCFIGTVSADEVKKASAEETVKEFLNNDGRIMGIASKGKWDTFPENSIPALKAAAETGIDMILVDVKQTSDKKLILFSDDTTERMLFSDTVYTVSETTFSELSAHFLRNSCGGSNEKASSCKIPTLDEALSFGKEADTALVIRCDASVIPAVSEEVNSAGMKECVIIMTEASPKETENALSQCKESPHIINTIKGNVIFVINNFVNSIEKQGFSGVQLKTGNRYGINFYPSLLSKYSSKMRVIADPTNPETCGARQDSESWWNDLISRGYSVIITDHPDIFTEYLERTDKSRERLQSLFDKYVTNHTLPDFKDDALNDMKKAYTDAVSEAERLLSDNSSAVCDMVDCYAALSKAANDISINFSSIEDGSAGTTVTLPRILLCIAFAAAAVAVQVYFFKRRKKEG